MRKACNSFLGYSHLHLHHKYILSPKGIFSKCGKNISKLINNLIVVV